MEPDNGGKWKMGVTSTIERYDIMYCVEDGATVRDSISRHMETLYVRARMETRAKRTGVM